MLEKITSILESHFRKPCIAFEHGGAPVSDGAAACVPHAHMHIVPVEEPETIVHSALSTATMEEVSSLDALASCCAARHYIYTLVGNRHRLFRSARFESQLMRKSIARSIGLTHQWDWKLFYFSENFGYTAKLKATFSSLLPADRSAF